MKSKILGILAIFSAGFLGGCSRDTLGMAKAPPQDSRSLKSEDRASSSQKDLRVPPDVYAGPKQAPNS